MAQEPETHNEISGQVSGDAWQIDHVHGDVNNIVNNTVNNNTVNNFHHQPVPVEEQRRFDFWLVLAGVLAAVNGITMVVASFELIGGFPLFGAGAVLDERLFLDSALLGGAAKVSAFCLGSWQIWTALDLFVPKRQARQRDRAAAQVALWMSFLPVYVAVGVPAEWYAYSLVGTAVALACVLRGPQVLLRERRRAAVVVGAIACVTWFVAEVHALWSDAVDVSVLWGLAGTLLLLVIVAVPVHAVLTAPAADATRTLRSWSLCLGIKFAVTVVIAQYGVEGGSVVFAWWLPIIGIGAMLLASSSIRERVSAPGA